MKTTVYRHYIDKSDKSTTCEYFIALTDGYFRYRVKFDSLDGFSIFDDVDPEYLVYVKDPYINELPDDVDEVTCPDDVYTVLLDLIDLSDDYEIDIKLLVELEMDCSTERAILSWTNECIILLTKLYASITR